MNGLCVSFFSPLEIAGGEEKGEERHKAARRCRACAFLLGRADRLGRASWVQRGLWRVGGWVIDRAITSEDGDARRGSTGSMDCSYSDAPIIPALSPMERRW